MEKEQIEQEAIRVCGEIAKGISFWGGVLTDAEWQRVSGAVGELKAIRQAAAARQNEELDATRI